MVDVIPYIIPAVSLGVIAYIIYWMYCEYIYLSGVMRVYEIHDPAEIKTFEANVSNIDAMRKKTNFADSLDQKNEPILCWWFAIYHDKIYVYRHNDWVVCPTTATAKHRRWYKCETYGDRMRDLMLELLKPIEVLEEKKE